MVLVALVTLGVAPATYQAPVVDETDWPQFLGPHRDGTVSYAIRRAWGDAAPEILWRRPVGAGYAAPSVADGKLYLFHRVGDEERVEALDAATGTTLWQTANPTGYHDDQFGFDEGPRASPTIVGGVVYTSGVERWLQALDAGTGERLWGFDPIERYGTRRQPFGAAAQPFWVDGRLVLNLGGVEAGIVALDAATGATAWTATDHEASYSAPLLAEIGGASRLFFYTRDGLVDLDPADGTVRAHFPWRSRAIATVNAAAPVRVGERVFVSSSYRTGAVLLEVTSDGFEPVWSEENALSNHYVTSIHHRGTLYGMHGRQPLSPSLRAVDAATGEVLWREPDFAGSLLLAGDTLIAMRETGELSLVDATPEEYRQLARVPILDQEVRAYPALAHGILYVRGSGELVAVDLREH